MPSLRLCCPGWPHQPVVPLPTCPQCVAPNRVNFTRLNTAVNSSGRHHFRGHDGHQDAVSGSTRSCDWRKTVRGVNLRSIQRPPQWVPRVTSLGKGGRSTSPPHTSIHSPASQVKSYTRGLHNIRARGPGLTVRPVPTFGNKSNVSSLPIIWTTF